MRRGPVLSTATYSRCIRVRISRRRKGDGAADLGPESGRAPGHEALGRQAAPPYFCTGVVPLMPNCGEHAWLLFWSACQTQTCIV